MFCFLLLANAPSPLSASSTCLLLSSVLPSLLFLSSEFNPALHATAPLDPSGKYIFCYHPHGILSLGAFLNFGSEATGFSEKFPGIDLRLLTLTSNFKIPFYGHKQKRNRNEAESDRAWPEVPSLTTLVCAVPVLAVPGIFLSLMGIADASRESCNACLSRGPGSSILLVLGGAKESLDAHPHRDYELTLHRKGFVKGEQRQRRSTFAVSTCPATLLFTSHSLVAHCCSFFLLLLSCLCVSVALENGADLVPVFSFGENDIWDQADNPRGSRLRKLQERLQQKLGFALPVVKGRGIWQYNWGLLPHRRRQTQQAA